MALKRSLYDSPMRSRARYARRLLAALLALGALAVAGCGGDGGDDDGTAGRAAPDPSEFPAAEGRTLDEVLAEAGSEGPVVSPAGQVFHRGQNRYSFGVFTPGREQITDAEVALYVAHGPTGEAKGPFPARIESLETEPEFEAETTAADPDAAQVVYVTELDFDQDGEWRVGALVRADGQLQASRAPSAVVGQFEDVPQPGQKAPRVHTPTADEVKDLSEIDTRQPPGTMHEDDLAEVLGKQAVVLVFATPALCQSRVCGPVVDVAEQVKAEHGDEAAFIHMEIYEDNLVDKGLRPQVEAYNLPTEPWAFVIDENGRIDTALEGALSVDELEQAVGRVTG